MNVRNSLRINLKNTLNFEFRKHIIQIIKYFLNLRISFRINLRIMCNFELPKHIIQIIKY